MSESHSGHLAHHFESLEQQTESATIGMWVFLAQEVMFFGGLFTCYLIFRQAYPESFYEGSHHLDVFWGTLNTAILICSSLTMALGVREAQLGRGKRVAIYIALTMVLGLAFLGIKSIEYSHKFHDGLIPTLNWQPGADAAPHLLTFFGLYFAMTGMHALHMLIGMVIMVIVAVKALRGRYTKDNYIGVEILGLYWHFVDLVWIFLFPLLYLLNRHVGHG